MKSDSLPGWVSYHFFYQGSRDRLLLELAQPLVAQLWRRGDLDRFFFIRYNLGGPHIRLRLQVRPGREGEVDRQVRERAAEFFLRAPSETVLDEEAIRRENQRLLANDPDGEDALHPNNSVAELAFHPETARYGGEELLPHSLDLFALSSVEALTLLRTHSNSPKPARLSTALWSLARLALGLASDSGDFLDLVRYAEIWSRGAGALFLSRGDEAFAKDPDRICRLLRTEILSLCHEETGPLAAAGRRLSREIASAEAALREIAVSHIHMTANRLGLNNPEEIYLGRMLGRAGQRLLEAEPEIWERFREESTACREVSLREMASSALDTLASEPTTPPPS